LKGDERGVPREPRAKTEGKKVGGVYLSRNLHLGKEIGGRKKRGEGEQLNPH